MKLRKLKYNRCALAMAWLRNPNRHFVLIGRYANLVRHGLVQMPTSIGSLDGFRFISSEVLQ